MENEETNVKDEIEQSSSNIEYQVRTVQLTREEFDQLILDEQTKFKHILSLVSSEKEQLERTKQKVLVNWKGIMELIKREDLKQKLEGESNLFETQLRSRDDLINSLEQRLGETVDQIELVITQNDDHISRLNTLVKEKIESLKKDFDGQLNILKKDFEVETQSLLLIHSRQVVL